MKGGTVRKQPGAQPPPPPPGKLPTIPRDKELRRDPEGHPAYFDYRSGWHGLGKNEAYWNRRRRRTRKANKAARRSRQINRRKGK